MSMARDPMRDTIASPAPDDEGEPESTDYIRGWNDAMKSGRKLEQIDHPPAPEGLSLTIVIPEIVWTDPEPPNGRCPYDHVFGITNLGLYSIEWKSWKDYDERSVFLNGKYIGGKNDLDSAKAFAKKHFTNFFKQMVETGNLESNGPARPRPDTGTKQRI